MRVLVSVSRWVRNLIKLVSQYGLYEIHDVQEGQARISPGQEVVLYDSRSAGVLSGFVNCEGIGGPNQAELRVEMYTEVPGDPQQIKPYVYRQATIARSAQTPFSPIIEMDAVYTPHGGRIVLKQTNGLATSYYYYIYRR